jgi:hypothetical protein
MGRFFYEGLSAGKNAMTGFDIIGRLPWRF